MATMNVSLPKRMKEWVEKRAAEGSFANSSDYIRDLIREDEERQRAYDEIMDAAESGLASGFRARPPAELRAAVREEMKTKSPRAERSAG